MNSGTSLIRLLRLKKQMSANELADMLCVSKVAVSNWENGEVPSVENLYNLSKIFRVTIDELISGKLNSENAFDYLVRNYDLSSYNVPQLIKEHNSDELICYYETCQRIKDRFLMLLPKAAKEELNNEELEEFKYIEKYINVDTNEIRYTIDFRSRLEGRLDKNEMAALNSFYGNISTKNKEERAWEIEKIYKHSFNIDLNSLMKEGLLNAFIEAFKLLKQHEKDLVLNDYINPRYMIDTIRNDWIQAMINNGAKVLVNNIPKSTTLDEHLMPYYDGKVEVATVDNRDYYIDSVFWENKGYCSYAEYQKVVDYKKTKAIKDIGALRKTKPKTYYFNLKYGEYDWLLDF